MVQKPDQTTGDDCCERSTAKKQDKRTKARALLLPVFTANFSAASNANENQFCKNGLTNGSTEIPLTSTRCKQEETGIKGIAPTIAFEVAKHKHRYIGSAVYGPLRDMRTPKTIMSQFNELDPLLNRRS